MISTSDFKRGVRIELDGDPYVILDVQHQSKTARGSGSFVNVKVRNLKTGQMLDRSFRSGERVDQPDFQLRQAQYLYRQGDAFFFLDQENYEQYELEIKQVGEASGYLTDGLMVRAMLFRGDIIGVELPDTVELRVVETDPVVKGATATARGKLAKLETGLEITVPEYLSAGEVVKVDTRDGHFLARVQK